MLKRQKKRDCGCSGHPRGRPKVSTGPCYGYGLREAVKERIRSRKLERAWKRALEPDDEEL